MRKLILPVVALMLSGCGHAQWVSVKDSTCLAGWVNPVGFAVHMAATVGELATRPSAMVAGGSVDSPVAHVKK